MTTVLKYCCRVATKVSVGVCCTNTTKRAKIKGFQPSQPRSQDLSHTAVVCDCLHEVYVEQPLLDLSMEVNGDVVTYSIRLPTPHICFRFCKVCSQCGVRCAESL